LYRREGFTVPAPIVERLVRHRYPGNVRELENLIKRMIVLDDPFLTRIPLPETDGNGGQSHGPTPSLPEREAIASMLEQTGWNRVRAARALRISYRALLYKIKQAGLDVERSSARSVL
jgi:DNA-binding NtrC family response regulator